MTSEHVTMMICDGCGSTMTDMELSALRQRDRRILSCCPERKMVRQCTCHPDEAPVPCERKYAYSECKAAAERRRADA